jgi:hypothetical protein
MIKLRKSRIRGNGYTIYNIPNVKKIKLAISKCQTYITLIGINAEKTAWFRLGDRTDLIPKEMVDFGLTSYRGSDEIERNNFIKKVVEIFAGLK